MDQKISIPEVRALARRDGSSLLEQATDEQIDAAIERDMGRPAATPVLLAASAANWCEFDVLVNQLRRALHDGSVLDYEPADGRRWRAFRKVERPEPSDCAPTANASAVADKQTFLAQRLITAAADIVDDVGADFNAEGRALAVAAAIFGAIADPRPTVAKAVIEALPADEWDAFIDARRACIEAYRRDQENAAGVLTE